MQRFHQKMSDRFATLWPAEDKTLVFGEGQSDHPAIMLIGEAPGEQETLQGRPFVGKAGKNLDSFLEIVGLKREDIYISNVVKIRPTKVSDKGRLSNRPPNKEELALFTPYLYEEILLVQPRMIVTLGNVALRALAGPKAVIGSMHGAASIVTVSYEKQTMECSLFPLYHPASIIYNRALQEVYQADLQALKKQLPAPAVQQENP
ncbi:MAG: uracil-DNA glycosylase [Clostridia bacterium]|nr:uracil-DNA glycosylase [Clostridia bacterium]